MKKVFRNSSVFVSKSKTGEQLLRSSIRKAILSTVLFSPLVAQALGLGVLTTNSALNEPFDARIQLLNTTFEELQTLTVSLGGVEQFKDAGIERPFLLSSLKFEIIENSTGNYLQISSDESIREPFLNFLLEVNWAKGRLIREYTALLDPPVFDTNTRIADTAEMAVSESVAAESENDNIRIEQLPDATLVSDADIEFRGIEESRESRSPVEEYIPQDQDVQEPESFQSESLPFSSGQSTYTTSRGDTLWEIARANRPDPSVNVQQMMLSLLNKNPDAFINNNINVLKTGQVLKIPEYSEINQLTRSEAIALVREHNALWDDYRQNLASNVALRPAGAVSSKGTVIADLEEQDVIESPEVRLLSATDDATVSGSSTGSGGNNDGQVNSLENDLALVSEQLVSGRNENAELKDRLRESEEIVELLKQQVELKNRELAALQKTLRAANLATGVELEKGVEAEDESIDDILAQLENEEESKTTYIEYDADLTDTDSAVTFEEYDAPAENLAGKEVDTQYLDEEDTALTELVEDTAEVPADQTEIDQQQGGIEGILNKIKGMLPEGITDLIPGGIKTVLAVILGLLGLFLFGIFKLIGGGRKDDTEVLDLLDPEELDSVEAGLDTNLDEATEEVVPDRYDYMVDDQATAEPEVTTEESQNEEETEEFDLDFEEELTDEISDLSDKDNAADENLEISAEDVVIDEASDLLDEGLEFDEDELTTEGLVDLDDTLDQIKPLLEQTEEDLDDDPLEEVNLSLAYEQFDKAEVLVNKAIEEHPEEDGYKLRLLEVHYAANNKESYENAAKSLYEVTDGEGHLWESAVAMWTEMSPERDLFEEKSENDSDSTETIDSQDFEEDSGEGLFDITSDTKGIIAGMSAAGAAAVGLVSSESTDAEDTDTDESDFINIADEDLSLEDESESAEVIDISADISDDDFLNIAEIEIEDDDFLNITEIETAEDGVLEQTQPAIEDELTLTENDDSPLTLEDGLDFEIDQDSVEDEHTEEDSLSIDMLDITAVGEANVVAGDDVSDADAEELFELTNEFKTVDENVLSIDTVEPEESAEILEFSSDDGMAILEEAQSEEPTVNTDILEIDDTVLDGDDDLESLAKSLEDTISGLVDTGELDDLPFDFDAESTFGSTLTSTLSVSTDIDLENEGDEIDTKLNLAKAYIELGDADGAKDILREVSADGNENQKRDAQELLKQIT